MIVVAEPIGRGLVGEDRVEDERQRALIFLEALRKGQGRLASHVAVRLVQLRQNLLLRHRLPVELVSRIPERLVEVAGPRLLARNALLGENLLFRFAEHVLLLQVLRLQVVAIVRQGLVVHNLFGPVVVDGGPLDLDENKLLLNAVVGLAHRLQERPALPVVRVGGPVQMGVRIRTAQAVLNGRQFVEGLGKIRRRKIGNPILVRVRKRLGGLIGRLQALRQFVAVVVQIVELPAHLVGARLRSSHRENAL